MTHDELNALCAEKVAHFKPYAHPLMTFKNGDPVMIDQPPTYCTDPAAVIELLEKHSLAGGGEPEVFRFYSPAHKEDTWTCEVIWLHHDGQILEHKITAPTFAEAGVRALLKAHGCEVGE